MAAETKKNMHTHPLALIIGLGSPVSAFNTFDDHFQTDIPNLRHQNIRIIRRQQETGKKEDGH